MNRIWPSFGLCLLLGGCVGPTDSLWNDSTYPALHDRISENDSRLSAPSPDEPGWAASGVQALGELSLDDAIRIAIAKSPRLRGAGFRVDAASGRVTQAGLYPNPTFAFDAEALAAESGGGGETIYRLEQEIVLGGKIRRTRGVAEVDRLSAQAILASEEFAVASRVTHVYFAAVASDERFARRRDLAVMAEQLLQAASARVEAGAATEADRLRAEVVVQRARLEEETARFDKDAARRALGLALDLKVEIDLPLTSSAEVLPRLPSRDEIEAAALASNSRVVIAHIGVERSRRSYLLTEAEAVPNLVASIGPRYSDSDGETTLDVGLGIEIPLFDRNQGEIQAAVADRFAAAARLQNVRLELLVQVSEAWAAYEASRLTAIRYREELLPIADRTLELTRQAYERGKADYLRLLDAQQVVAESRIAYVDSLQTLHETAATLRELAQIDASWRSPRDGAVEEISQ
jgi:cobalt-zinc-cadmium efflux system outer membrane protein